MLRRTCALCASDCSAHLYERRCHIQQHTINCLRASAHTPRACSVFLPTKAPHNQGCDVLQSCVCRRAVACIIYCPIHSAISPCGPQNNGVMWPCLTCSTVGLKPNAGFTMSAKLDASVNASFRTTVTAKQSMLAGFDMLRGGGFMDFPSRELVPGETTKDFQTTGCGASINMDMSGGLGLVFSWLVPSKFTDMFMVTVPYLEWKHPFKLEVSPTPFTTQQGRQCNMCNAACPRAKFSLVPTINWGAKVWRLLPWYTCAAGLRIVFQIRCWGASVCAWKALHTACKACSVVSKASRNG